MRACLALLVTLAIAAGRVADPPTYRQLLHKLVDSPDLQRFMRHDPGSVQTPLKLGSDLDKTTLELIRENGYPAEQHDVTTADGYILSLHRIPHGRDGPSDGPRTVVHLQHGLLSASSDWIMQPPERALGKLVASGISCMCGHMIKNNPLWQLPAEALELARDRGYPAEEHIVTTADGYRLGVHRLPGTGPAVLLQHGLLDSSAAWLLNPRRPLGYMLADLGYDVWLGNARGNTYSRSHVNMTAKDADFWKFTWDQMGQYDCPAMIDYILETTGQEQLFWVGHSMGTTMFWVMMNDHPEYNDKIALMQGLGPVARVDHMHSVIRIIAPFANEIELLLQWFGENEFLPAGSHWMRIVDKYFCDRDRVDEKICRNALFAIAGYDSQQFNLALAELIGYDEFLPSNEFMTLLAELVCEPWEATDEICDNILFLLCGYDPQQLNQTALPVILAHTPAGASTRTVVHYAQEINAEAFVHFDWGKEENMVRYGQATPPEYDLSYVTCPVSLFWSDNDLLADPEDATWLAERLPNIVEKYRVPLASFNHLDYLWAIDGDTLVYNHVIENIKKFSK